MAETIRDKILSLLDSALELAGELEPGPWVAIQFNKRLSGRDPIFPDGLWHILPENNVERLPIAIVDKADDHWEPVRVAAKPLAEWIAASRSFAPMVYRALREEVAEHTTEEQQRGLWVCVFCNWQTTTESPCGFLIRIAAALGLQADSEREEK